MPIHITVALLQDDERMTNFSIDEQLKKHDTDKDGYITYEEFLSKCGSLLLYNDRGVLEQIRRHC